MKIFGFNVFKSNVEKEIQALYEEHCKALAEQKQKLFDDITEWGDALIQSIYKHTSQQQYYLEQNYAKQVRFLNEAYKNFIQDLRVREEMKKTEEVDQLIQQFKELKYQLAALESHIQNVPFIEVPDKQKLSTKKPDEFDNAEIGKNQINNGSREKGDNGVNNYVVINSDPRQSLSREQTRSAKYFSMSLYRSIA